MMHRRGSVLLFPLVLTALAALSFCTKPYRDQVREREFSAMETYLRSQKLTVWKYDDFRYAAVERGDSLNVQNGDVLELRYSLFALSSSKLALLATNDTATARIYQMPPQAFDSSLLRVEIGKTPLIKGLEVGIKNYAHLNGRAWLGIPSDLAYGRKRFGNVPSNTPILCQIQVVSATSERVPSEE